MISKNLRLLFYLIISVLCFTFVISAVFLIGGPITGSALTFVLILSFALYSLRHLIIQSYDLLSHPPEPGTQINPFQLVIFGKTLFQYPEEGQFVFMESRKTEDGTVRGSPKTPMEIPLFRRSNAGPKPRYTEEEYFHFVELWFAAEQKGIKQEDFCRLHNVGTPRTLRKYIAKYTKQKQLIPN
jgi:hypothetical protein